MKRSGALLLAGALALTAAVCAGQTQANSPTPSIPEESGQPAAAYVSELRIGTTAAPMSAGVIVA